jgi:N-acetylglucosaminyl-diphospho-decaprenol L-rhamnosyltransferase
MTALVSKVTVIIPTMLNNSGLFYLVNLLSKEKVNTIIIDNQPNSKKHGLSNIPGITYLPQTKNIGFAAAVNIGAKTAKTEWLLILNDDIELKLKQSFSQLISELIKFTKINKLTAVSPVLQNKQGRVENYGYKVLPFGKVELVLSPQNDINIDGLTAACLLIRRDTFINIGGFDKRFFAYLEDVDLFLTLKEQGYKFGIAPNIGVIHNHLTTSSKLKKGFKEWHDFKNWILISFKHSAYFHFNKKFIKERFCNLNGLIKKYV